MALDAIVADAKRALLDQLGVQFPLGESLLHAVLHAPVPIMLFDEAGRILLLSDAWLKSCRYGALELNSIEDWAASAQNREEVVRHFRLAIDGKPTARAKEFSFDGKDGRRLWWSLAVSALGPLPDGHRLFICTASDVTEERLAGAASRDDDRHFRQLLDALPAAIYTTDAAGRITFYNRAAAELWGYPPLLGSLWCGSLRLYWPDGRPMAHDQCPMAVALKENRPVRGAEAMAERPDGTMITFIPYPTPLHDAAGKLTGAVNMLVDITARKKAERRLHLLAREVDHRAKNMLAVIQGVVHFTRAETVRDFASAIEGRVMALARAHCLLSDSGWEGADIKRLVEDELAQYGIPGTRRPGTRRPDTRRVTIEGKRLMLAPAVAQSVAMTLHELARNAAKYGALSGEEGRVTVSWAEDAEKCLSLRWEEAGVPSVQPPVTHGFGINLIERTISDQLGGVVRFDWSSGGLICRLEIPMQPPARVVAA